MKLTSIFVSPLCGHNLQQTNIFPLSATTFTPPVQMLSLGNFLWPKWPVWVFSPQSWGQTFVPAGLCILQRPVICSAHHYQTWLIQHMAKDSKCVIKYLMRPQTACLTLASSVPPYCSKAIRAQVVHLTWTHSHRHTHTRVLPLQLDKLSTGISYKHVCVLYADLWVSAVTYRTHHLCGWAWTPAAV